MTEKIPFVPASEALQIFPVRSGKQQRRSTFRESLTGAESTKRPPAMEVVNTIMHWNQKAINLFDTTTARASPTESCPRLTLSCLVRPFPLIVSLPLIDPSFLDVGDVTQTRELLQWYGSRIRSRNP